MVSDAPAQAPPEIPVVGFLLWALAPALRAPATSPNVWAFTAASISPISILTSQPTINDKTLHCWPIFSFFPWIGTLQPERIA